MLNAVFTMLIAGGSPAPTPGHAATPASAPTPTPADAPATIPDFMADATRSPGWRSVPTSFRPDPSILPDEDTARLYAIEIRRQAWITSILDRADAPDRPSSG